MPAMESAADRGPWKPLVAVLLLVSLTAGLTACRGFFGQAPIALLDVNPRTDEEVPVEVLFDISGSNDPDGTITSYVLDFDDGSTQTGSDVSAAIPPHTYTVAGTYTVILRVTDNDGRIGMDSEIVVIGPAMLTFASDRGVDGDYDIWRMKANGTDAQIVLNTPEDEFFPDLVRGTRGKIAYASNAAQTPSTATWEIWTMTVEGNHANQLTTQTLSNQLEPSWSSDGTKIAYASNVAQTPSMTTWEIYTMPAAGGSPTKLTSQSPSCAIAPAYSPVNDDLVFVSCDNTAPSNKSSIWLLPAGGDPGDAYKLKDTTGEDGAVSPAGFLTGLSPALGLPAGMGISKPAWSPGGTKLAFSTDKDGDIDIYVMDADGNNLKTLEAYVVGLLGTPVSDITTDKHEFCPYWLEDGSGLVFVREEDSGAYNLYKVSFSTGLVTQLTSDGTGNNVTPAAKK
ncbi:MAG: PKD domain-containing protein [Candidatus Bipolaricaulota bacterium]|nr:PKD domain-containing protein [Candidatus Bipolaricaulota bacterium]